MLTEQLWCILSCGVPQGTVPGPLLLLLHKLLWGILWELFRMFDGIKKTKKILARPFLHNMSLNGTFQKHFYTLNSPAIYKAEWLTMPLLGLIIVKYSQKCLQVVQKSCCVAELLSRRRLRRSHFTPTVESLHSIQLESGSYFKSLSLLLEWWMVEHLLVSKSCWCCEMAAGPWGPSISGGRLFKTLIDWLIDQTLNKCFVNIFFTQLSTHLF